MDAIGTAIKNCDISPIGKAAETVQLRFTALQVAAVTAIQNITNSAMDAGKRILKSFTIEPIKTGFHEFELKMGSVQTIMAGTGESLATVNKYLEELNEYSDQTIYSFSDMTSNIGKFTNAGVSLKDSVAAIKGVSNAAALAGANSQQASHAMYNFAQALSSGFVKLIDWKSIENANMATVGFKEELLKTALACGTVTKNADGMYKTVTTNAKGKVSELFNATRGFNDALNHQWMTTEVLTKTLARYSDETTEVGKKATAAAKDVKTFSMLMDTLKEAVQSGWAQTWELIIGDFEKGKTLFTEMSDFFGDIIKKSADSRNAFIKTATESKWDILLEQIQEAGFSVDDFEEKVKSVATEHRTDIGMLLTQYGSLSEAIKDGKVSAIVLKEAFDSLNGSLIDLSKIKKKLEKGDKGNDVLKAQKALKQLKYDLGEFGEKLDGVDGVFGKVTEEAVRKFQKEKDILEDGILGPETLKALEKAARGTSEVSEEIYKLIDSVTELGGRDMLIESLKNIMNSLKHVLDTVGSSWGSVFGEFDGKQITHVIEKFYNFTSCLKLNDDQTEKLKKTFEGLFSILKIFNTVIGTGVKMVLAIFEALTGTSDVLNWARTGVLDFTASIGDSIVKFQQWLESNKIIEQSFVRIVEWVLKASETIRSWIDTFKDVPFVQTTIDNLTTTFSNFKEIGINAIAGLKQGLEDGTFDIPSILALIGTQILNSIKTVLGIHSPSTEMYDVGTNTIVGLYNGIVDKFSKIDWSKIFSGLLSLGVVGIIKSISDGIKSLNDSINNITKSVEAVTAPLRGVGDVLTGVGQVLRTATKPINKILKNTAKVVKSFANVMNSIAFEHSAKGISEIIKSLALLLGAIALLTLTKPENLDHAVTVVMKLAGVIAAFALMALMLSKSNDSFAKGALDMASFGSMLAALGTTMLLMAIAIKLIGSLDPKQAALGFGGLTACVIAIGLVLTAYTKVAKNMKAVANIEKVGAVLLKMAASILIMGIVIKLIGGMSWDDLAKGAAGLVLFGVVIAGLMAATKLLTGSKNIDKIGAALLKVSAAFLIMAVVVKIIGDMEWNELKQGIGGLIIFGAIIAGLMWATKLVVGSKNVDKIGGAILGIAGAMALMAVTAKIIAGMDIKEFGHGVVGVIALGLIAVMLLKMVKNVGPQAPKLAITILAISVAIGILAGISLLLGLVNIAHLAKGVAAVGLLGLVVAAMIASTRGAQDCKSNLIVMTAAIAVLAAAVIALSFIPFDALWPATAAMALLVGMFAVLALASKNATGSIGTLIVMTVAVGLIAGVLLLLSKLGDPNALLPTAAALSLLIAAVGGVLLLLGVFPVNLPAALQGVVGLLAMCVPLLAFIGLLALMQNIQVSIQNAEVLIALATVMTLLLIPLTLIGTLGPTALIGVGALLAMCIPLVAFIGLLALMNEIPNAISNAEILITLATIMTGLLTQLAIIGPMALIGVVALTGLVTLMGIMGGLVVAIGALTESFPGIEDFVNNGISLLIALANGLGQIVGAFVGGMAEGLFASLPNIAASLSSFINELQPFLIGAKSIDQEALSGVKALVEMILLITGASIVDKLASWLTGGSSLEEFSKKLVPFGKAMMEFSTSVKDIDTKAVQAAANAGKMIADMAATIPNDGGLLGKFFGENDMRVFADNLPILGRGMLSFSKSIEGINTEAVEAAATVGKMLADLAGSIPNSGGFLGKFLGENDIDAFGEKLPILGAGILQFSKSVVGLSTESVEAGANAGKMLVDMAATIPNSGGSLAKFLGDNDIDSFGKRLVDFGDYLVQFSSHVQGKIDLISSTKAKTMAMSFIDVSKKIIDAGSLTNQKPFEKFGADLTWLGLYLAQFGDHIANLNTEKTASVIDMIKSLVKSAKDMSGDMKTFGTNLTTLGETGLDKFIESFSTKQATQKLATAAEEMVTNFLNAVKSKDTDFVTSGSNAIDRLIDGIKSLGHSVTNHVIVLMSNALEAIKDKYSDFEKKGKYLVEGFAEGIAKNTKLATDATIEMVKKVIKAAAEQLDEHSPSKVFFGIGAFAGEGLVNGLNSYGDKVYSAGSIMGENARQGLSAAIAKISEFIESGVDTEPTIRPVLDLTDIKSGSNALSKMTNGWNGISLSGSYDLATSSLRGMQSRAAYANDNSALLAQCEKLIAAAGQNGPQITNEFHITGDNPKEIANEVSRIIQQQVSRRNAAFGQR